MYWWHIHVRPLIFCKEPYIEEMYMYTATCIYKIVANQHNLVAVAKVVDKAAKRSLGVWMYWRNAALCQQPSIWIAESSIPTAAAEVAAPIWKLWPAKWCCGKPIAHRMSRVWVMKRGLVITLWAESRKKTPGWSPRSSKYLAIAATTQRGEKIRRM